MYMNNNYESPQFREIDLLETCILCLSVLGEGSVDNVEREEFEW